MYDNAVVKGLIDPVKFLEDGCPAVSCSKLNIDEANKLILDNCIVSLVASHDGHIDGLDETSRIMFSFKSTCPFCGYEQVRTNYAIDIFMQGVKYCEKCSLRYFVAK